MNTSEIELILHAGLVVKAVLALLVIFSIVSWTIIFYKWRFFSVVKKENERFLHFFRIESKATSLERATSLLQTGPFANVFRYIYMDKYVTTTEDLRRALKRYTDSESAKMEKYLNFLATTGSTAPFIGLFGTVWGIMDAFRGIGSAGTAALAVVAPGIAEALITTAVGLLAAIPAVIGYNYFLSVARYHILDAEDFSEDLFSYFVRKKQS